MRMKDLSVMVLSAVVLAGGWGVARAQMESTSKASGPAAGAQAEPAKAVDALLTMFESEFVTAAKAMPAEKYSFAPSTAMIPGSKYEGVRTFAGEIAHVAQANYFFYSSVSGMKPDVDVKAIANLQTKDELLAALAASFAYAHKAVATLTRENAFDVVKGPGLQTRTTLATFGIAHGFDHYGQMVEYLRMNGIVPAGSK